MYIPPYTTDQVIRPMTEFQVQGNQHIVQPTFYTSHTPVSQIHDNSVVLSQPARQPTIITGPTIIVDPIHSQTYPAQPFINDAAVGNPIHDISITPETGETEEISFQNKRPRFNADEGEIDRRLNKKEATQKGIIRFYASTTLGRMQPANPPSIEMIESDPKQYYSFLMETLQCFGCNYFDRQGTEKGRGGEITVLQKVNGVMDRIASMERQWEADEHNPDFPAIRKAWRRNIYSYWEQICKKLQCTRYSGVPGLIDSAEEPAGYTSMSGGASEGMGMGGEDGLHMEFTGATSLDDVYVYNDPHKPREEGGNRFTVGTSQSHQETSSAKNGKKINSIPFPDDLRHYRNLNLIRIALKMNGLDSYIRQKNTLKLLKIIGEYELSRPSFNNVKEGGLFSVPGIQLLLPAQCSTKEDVTSSTPCMLINSNRWKKSTQGQDGNDENNHPGYNSAECLKNSLMSVITIQRSCFSNCSIVNGNRVISIQKCILFHDQTSQEKSELECETRLKSMVEDRIRQFNGDQNGSILHIITTGCYKQASSNENLIKDVSQLAQLLSYIWSESFLSSSVYSITILRHLQSSKPQVLEEAYDAPEIPPIPGIHESTGGYEDVREKWEPFFVNVFSNRMACSKCFSRIFMQSGYGDSGAFRVATTNGVVNTIGGIVNVYLIDHYSPAISLLLATDCTLSWAASVEIFTQCIQCTFLTVFFDRQNRISPFDSFRLINTTVTTTTISNDDLKVIPADDLSLDEQRVFQGMFSLCKELAFSMARKLLVTKKMIIVVVTGGSTNRICQNIAMNICNSMLFRLQFGEKKPSFPWNVIRAVLVEQDCKLANVTITVNAVTFLSDEVFIKDTSRIIDEQVEKRVVKIDISIGTLKGYCEAITTELNDRILKRYQSFCNLLTTMEKSDSMPKIESEQPNPEEPPNKETDYSI